MNEDRIGEALRALPREAADPEFTRAVLARLEAERGRGRRTGAAGVLRSGRLVWAGAALGAAGLAVVAGLFVAGGPGGARPTATGETAKEEGVAGPPAAEPPAPDLESAGTAPGRDDGPRPATALAGARPGEPAGLFQARAELAELRRRHHRFASELRTLDDFGGDGGPVLYLGGDEALEVVLKLGPAGVGALPASTHSGGVRTRPAVDRRPPSSPRYR